MSWIAAMILYGNLWLADGYQLHLTGPRAGWFVHAQTGDCRTVLPTLTPQREQERGRGYPLSRPR